MFTYWDLFWHMQRWFATRWWNMLADNNALMDYCNFTIQDIYNEDNATFLYVTEELTWVVWATTTEFTTTNTIRKIQSCEEVLDNWQLWNVLTPTLFWLKRCSMWNMIFNWTKIYTDKSVTKIYVTYIKEYVWVAYPAWLTVEVPLPRRYIPSLLKLSYDWASPINLMAWESQLIDFYSHWINRLNKLVQEDSLTDYINARPAY